MENVVKKLRCACGLSVREAARKTGLKCRELRKIESFFGRVSLGGFVDYVAFLKGELNDFK